MRTRRTAEEYGVPRSTLGGRTLGRVIPGAKSGAPTYLSPEEEEELVQFLMVLKCRDWIPQICARSTSSGWCNPFEERRF